MGEPAGHAYPALQGPVHSDDVRPWPWPNLPAVQFRHTAAPDELYLPGGHKVALAEPVGHEEPAGHRAAVAFVDPARQKYPAAQGPVQLMDVTFWVPPYRPAGHCRNKRTPCEGTQGSRDGDVR